MHSMPYDRRRACCACRWPELPFAQSSRSVTVCPPEETPRMDANATPRVVLVHDWLTGMRGGEKCLEVLCRRWPEAPLFTLLHKRGAVSPAIEDRPIHASFFRLLPKVERYYRYLLPLM